MRAPTIIVLVAFGMVTMINADETDSPILFAYIGLVMVIVGSLIAKGTLR